MALTAAQRTTLAAHIRANTDPAVVAALSTRNDTKMQELYNAPSSFIVWKKSIPTSDVGVTVNYIAVEAMTDANRTRITTFYAMNPVSFAPRSDIRSFWANTFSGALGGEGQNTRDALEALWRRQAKLAERVFVTGTGTTLAPGDLTWEGDVSVEDIGRALNDNP